MKKPYKTRALHRAKIIKGQFRALVEAIESDKYCTDLMTQSLAIQQSLRSLNKLVLENHLNTHVKQSMDSGDDKAKQAMLDELVHLYYLSSSKG